MKFGIKTPTVFGYCHIDRYPTICTIMLGDSGPFLVGRGRNSTITGGKILVANGVTALPSLETVRKVRATAFPRRMVELTAL